ncbi:alpha-ketoglutarate-dependent dioxygenase AlkB [Sphaerisporangium rubeum]|uniref:Alkylated DNA repair dioxygenase AlkB n=1 Tax=Sphaerisporangium rubeum TaxID=321317 RepID=A0A7X0M6Y2_9ACTN|nr:alpha-ketoglutarate-dependent dioxygenase AlkB [Sphaerisporangium rubeum]MBB6473732.1 alkylated DNA repair dioxygenase AlkB [Sphaerisporangium rubeum]
MTAGFQASLLDLGEEPGLGPLGATVRRTHLTDGAWLDLRPAWLTGADALFDRLSHKVPWHAERRHMYDRMVAVPRLLKFYEDHEPFPDPLLDQAMRLLNAHYAGHPGTPFRTAGLCLYRDGRDSVAWHGDRIGRGAVEDTMVAILSLGTPRPLLLRPRGGGPSIRHDLGHGDLIVMGGTCQRTWDHSIPKLTRPTGPRISIQFRPHDVR